MSKIVKRMHSVSKKNRVKCYHVQNEIFVKDVSAIRLLVSIKEKVKNFSCHTKHSNRKHSGKGA